MSKADAIERSVDDEERIEKDEATSHASGELQPVFRDGIQLSPTPSDDPADPLNWKPAKKNFVLVSDEPKSLQNRGRLTRTAGLCMLLGVLTRLRGHCDHSRIPFHRQRVRDHFISRFVPRGCLNCLSVVHSDLLRPSVLLYWTPMDVLVLHIGNVRLDNWLWRIKVIRRAYDRSDLPRRWISGLLGNGTSCSSRLLLLSRTRSKDGLLHSQFIPWNQRWTADCRFYCGRPGLEIRLLDHNGPNGLSITFDVVHLSRDAIRKSSSSSEAAYFQEGELLTSNASTTYAAI